jgi:dUTPase
MKPFQQRLVAARTGFSVETGTEETTIRPKSSLMQQKGLLSCPNSPSSPFMEKW